MKLGAPTAGLILALAAVPVAGQSASVRVYSEFARIDPFGKVVSADRPRPGAQVREILSPALARNSHATYHLAVSVPPGVPFTLYVGQNPKGLLGVSLYKETHVRRGGEWIPDGLELVKLPYAGGLPDSSAPIRGQTTVTFLMDLWVPFNTRVQRTKIEPEVYVGDHWITYPMEARVMPAIIPAVEGGGSSLGGVEQPSDATARAVLRAYLCGTKAGADAASGTIRWHILRDARQDVALARSLESRPGEKLLPEILRLAGSGDAAKWCQSPVFPEELGPEWYLRLRDALYRMGK